MVVEHNLRTDHAGYLASGTSVSITICPFSTVMYIPFQNHSNQNVLLNDGFKIRLQVYIVCTIINLILDYVNVFLSFKGQLIFYSKRYGVTRYLQL